MAKGFKDDDGFFHPFTVKRGKIKPDIMSIEPNGTTEIFLSNSERAKVDQGNTRIIRNNLRILSETPDEQEKNIIKGEKILNDFQSLEDAEGSGLSYISWVEGQNQDVKEHWLENFGRDEDEIREFIDNRLENKKNSWNFANPFFAEKIGETDTMRSLFTEDFLGSGLLDKSNKGGLYWSNITPEDFLSLATDLPDEGDIDELQKRIQEGLPISTPLFSISWNEDEETWQVGSHEGRHRSVASVNEGLPLIPVAIEPDIPIWEMTEQQDRSLKNALLGGVSRFSFIGERSR